MWPHVPRRESMLLQCRGIAVMPNTPGSSRQPAASRGLRLNTNVVRRLQARTSALTRCDCEVEWQLWVVSASSRLLEAAAERPTPRQVERQSIRHVPHVKFQGRAVPRLKET